MKNALAWVDYVRRISRYKAKLYSSIFRLAQAGSSLGLSCAKLLQWKSNQVIIIYSEVLQTLKHLVPQSEDYNWLTHSTKKLSCCYEYNFLYHKSNQASSTLLEQN